jgi:hypothetical protein
MIWPWAWARVVMVDRNTASVDKILIMKDGGFQYLGAVVDLNMEILVRSRGCCSCPKARSRITVDVENHLPQDLRLFMARDRIRHDILYNEWH